MNSRRWFRGKEWCFLALGLLAIFAFPLPAFSQSCALCYTQAASAGQKMIQALRSGILILVIPPTLGSIGMVLVLRQKGKQVRRTDESDEPFSEWQDGESKSERDRSDLD